MTTTAPDPFRLDGKVAAITGAGSGIGAAIAELFGARGASIALLELDAASGTAQAEQLRSKGIEAEYVPCDVTQDALVAGAIARVVERFEALDVLVNNAGIGHVGSLANTTEQDFDRLYAVNVKGVFLCSKHALPHLVSARGVVCNLASIASLIGIADRFAYSMTKGAVLTMTKSIALD